MEHRPAGPWANWEQDAPAQNVLALLGWQSVLIAVTLQAWVGERQFDITVSKALDEVGQWAGQYWWEVDRLTADGTGGLIREKRWVLGLCPSGTAEAAYQAAVRMVLTGQRPGPVLLHTPPV